MNSDCLKLTAYFGERDRAGDAFVADRLLDLFGSREVASSILLRGIEGYGGRRRLQTERLLTLSEDLPVAAVAVDRRELVEALVPDARALMSDGLLTLERARLVSGGIDPAELRGSLHEETKLTVYCGRREPFAAVVDALRAGGVDGATVLLGVDGTAHGARRRARFFAGNADVPLMIVSVGRAEPLAAAAAEIERLLARPIATVERITVCKRDGQLLTAPPPAPADGWRQKVMVYGTPDPPRLVRRLRERGAAGATVLRGIWGYHGDHAPHGDRALSLERRAPTLTIAVDTPEALRGWWPVVDEETRSGGLVTSEFVPAVAD